MVSRMDIAILAGAALLASPPLPVSAQEAAPAASPAISMELNGLEPAGGGCRLTFVVSSGLSADIAKAVYEVALFNKAGQVERLMTLDFQSLPAGRTRVRQFDLGDLACEAVSRILVNDATECAGEGVAPAACMRDLATRTATEVGFGS